MQTLSGSAEAPSTTAARVAQGIVTTSLVAAATYLTMVNALPAWHGTRFLPDSVLELALTTILTLAATRACIWRLATGDADAAELERFGDAIGDNAEFPDMDALFGMRSTDAVRRRDRSRLSVGCRRPACPAHAAPPGSVARTLS